ETPTVDEMIFAYKQLAARAHDFGVKVYGVTLIPFRGLDPAERGPYNSPVKEDLRQAVNRWMRTCDTFDAVIDFEAVMEAPTVPGAMNPEYDSGDHVHPGPKGYQAMADSIDLSLFR